MKFCLCARLLRGSIQCDLPPFLGHGSTYRAERALYAETCSGVYLCQYKYILEVFSDGLMLNIMFVFPCVVILG